MGGALDDGIQLFVEHPRLIVQARDHRVQLVIEKLLLMVAPRNDRVELRAKHVRQIIQSDDCFRQLVVCEPLLVVGPRRNFSQILRRLGLQAARLASAFAGST